MASWPHGPMVPNEAFKGMGEVRFGIHWVDRCEFTVKTSEKLCHSAVGMSTNPIIMSRHLYKDGVGGKLFIEASDIGSGELRLKVLVEPVMFDSMVLLTHIVKGVLDAVSSDPAKVGTEGLEIREASFKILGLEGKEVHNMVMQSRFVGGVIIITIIP